MVDAKGNPISLRIYSIAYTVRTTLAYAGARITRKAGSRSTLPLEALEIKLNSKVLLLLHIMNVVLVSMFIVCVVIRILS